MNWDKEREKNITSSVQFGEMYEQYSHEIVRLKEIRKALCCELSKLDENKLSSLFQATHESILSIEKALEYLTASARLLGELQVGSYSNPPNKRIEF